MRSGQYWEVLLPKGFVKAEDEPPDLGPFDFYIDAFRELGSCRSNSMGLGPIPFTAIVQYSSLYDVGEFEEFHDIIRQMDNVFIALNEKKPKKENKPKGGTDATKHSGQGNNGQGRRNRS